MFNQHEKCPSLFKSVKPFLCITLLNMNTFISNILSLNDSFAIKIKALEILISEILKREFKCVSSKNQRFSSRKKNYKNDFSASKEYD